MLTSIPEEKDQPTKVRLEQNYPNPFNPVTNIQFSLPEVAEVHLAVFNALGQKVRTLVNQKMNGGSHSVTFDARRLPSGMYIYRLETGEVSRSRQMLLIK